MTFFSTIGSEDEVLDSEFWLRVEDFDGCEAETVGKSNVMIEFKLIQNEDKLLKNCRNDKLAFALFNQKSH
jgi:hypothetical protein